LFSGNDSTSNVLSGFETKIEFGNKQVFPVILKGTIPSNIQNYSVYKLSDTLDSALTYIEGTEVYAGSI